MINECGEELLVKYYDECNFLKELIDDNVNFHEIL